MVEFFKLINEGNNQEHGIHGWLDIIRWICGIKWTLSVPMLFFSPPTGKKPRELHVYTSIQTPTGETNTVHESYFSGLPSGTFYPLLIQKH